MSIVAIGVHILGSNVNRVQIPQQKFIETNRNAYSEEIMCTPANPVLLYESHREKNLSYEMCNKVRFKLACSEAS